MQRIIKSNVTILSIAFAFIGIDFSILLCQKIQSVKNAQRIDNFDSDFNFIS